MSSAVSASLRGLLLALLPAVGVAVWWDGQHYDPGLLDFKQQAGKTGLSLPDQLATWSRLAGVRVFDKGNLYEYVNGHAEYFLAAGFGSLTVAEYGQKSASVPALTVDLFHMGTPLQAFGVLMDESSGKAGDLSDGLWGHADPRGVQMMAGPYFVRLSAFADGAPLPAIARQLARFLGPSTDGAMVFRFPDLGQTGTTRYIKENYRGWEFLHQVVERSFQVQGETVRVFRSDHPAHELDALENRIQGFFQDAGAHILREERQGVVFTRIEDPYEGRWFHFRDRQGLVGVFSPWREAWVEELLRFARDDYHREKNLP